MKGYAPRIAKVAVDLFLQIIDETVGAIIDFIDVYLVFIPTEVTGCNKDGTFRCNCTLKKRKPKNERTPTRQ
ncbi:unnamed protein product [Cunninghamella blakesleeana]